VLGGFTTLSIKSGVAFLVFPVLLYHLIEDTGGSLEQVSMDMR
jgi:hypothetical protein